jgi:hypothetical protein
MATKQKHYINNTNFTGFDRLSRGKEVQEGQKFHRQYQIILESVL